jgi:SNF2 family DNA or RNA helicase
VRCGDCKPDEHGLIVTDRVTLERPDWRKWLTDRAKLPARDPRDYELHLAAVEWGLSSALDINRREDFLSLPSPNVEPFAHQVNDAILFFRRLSPRGLIADDEGLGKTITAGLVARELLERGRIDSLLVVCPKSLVEQWQEELDSKFGIKAVPAVGGDFSGLDRHQFWITSYHTARSRIDAVRARKFDLVILDEAHALRNLYGGQAPPQVAKAFEQLMREDSVRYCVMLTATPIQNRLWDMFSLLEILKAPQPNPLGTPDIFRSRYIADPAARRLRGGTQEEFRRNVAEATVRTRRADTKLLFPERDVRTEPLTPLPDERQYIEAALDAILQFPKLVQITHARTLMSSPWAAAAAFEREAEKPNIRPAQREGLLALSRQGRAIATSAKIEAVVKLAQVSARQGVPGRLIVFTQRIETLRHLEAALQTAGFAKDVAIMQGGEAQANRRAIRDFMAEPPARRILLSTDTGAVGLNLQAGNIVVNYDLPWNPMLLEQRIGRIQRLGQKARKVVVHNLVLTGTIEDAVVRRLMEKLELFSQAIGEMEELLELCGYDEEHRSLDQVIMDLIRKAAEQKDIEEDLRRMEESRLAAEERMRRCARPQSRRWHRSAPKTRVRGWKVWSGSPRECPYPTS